MIDTYRAIRSHSEAICRPLKTEDYVPQPIELVSPPKWQLAHTSWFFEYFILIPNCKTHKEYNPLYSYFFNSYYNYAGDRVVRHSRGDMSRPTVEEVYTYRKYVDDSMIKYMAGEIPQGIKDLIRLGLNHEQQHQELLLTDIKYILGFEEKYPNCDIITLTMNYRSITHIVELINNSIKNKITKILLTSPSKGIVYCM